MDTEDTILFRYRHIQISRKHLLIPLFVFVLLFFTYNDLSVRINEINYWDEAQYAIRGELFIQGTLPEFAWSPFTSAFFALLYLPFHSTVNWVPIVVTLGRVIIYLLLLMSLYLVSREINVISWTTAIFGMALVYPAMVWSLKFQSDALFAVTSAFSLWQVLRYRNSGKEKHLWFASSFSGFAALTRNDGLILFVSFLVIVFVVIKNKDVSLKRKIVSTMVPFLTLTLGYILLYTMVTGNLYVGIAHRSWGAFRQGQYFIYGHDAQCETNQLKCAIERVRELYGTGEENNYSVLHAIFKNPYPYMERLKISLRKIPAMVYRAYGGRTAFSLIIFSAIGIFKLLRTKNKEILVIFLLWMLYLPVYLLTFYRPGYFYLPYYVIYILGLVGVFDLLLLFKKKNPREVISALLVIFSILGFVFNLVAVYFTSILLLIALWLGYWILPKENGGDKLPEKLVPALFILIVGIMLHGTFDPVSFANKPPTAEEEAITVLYNEFPRETLVAAGSPGAVASAHMQFVLISDFDAETSEDLYNALALSGVQAIYVDPSLSNTNEYMWNLIELEIGNLYERIYSGKNGSIQVLKMCR